MGGRPPSIASMSAPRRLQELFRALAEDVTKEKRVFEVLRQRARDRVCWRWIAAMMRAALRCHLMLTPRQAINDLVKEPPARDFVADICQHCKHIGHGPSEPPLLERLATPDRSTKVFRCSRTTRRSRTSSRNGQASGLAMRTLRRARESFSSGYARRGAGTVSSCRRFAFDGDGRCIRKSITG